MPNRDFAAAVRRQRVALGLTRETLAERADVSIDYVRRVEAGAVSPTIRYAARLAAGLGVPLPVLVADVRLGARGEAGLRLLAALAEYVDAGPAEHE